MISLNDTVASFVDLNIIRRVRRMQQSVLAVIHKNNEDMPLLHGNHRCAFITLTYRPGVLWEPRHITYLQKRYEYWSKKLSIKLSIVWVMELTRQGVPHYHLLIWLPKGITPPMPDKQGWWPHGSTNAQWLRRPSCYIAKYFSKSDSKKGRHMFPKGARIFGVRGLSEGAKLTKHYWSLPVWLRKYCEVGDKCKRLFSGWWYHENMDYSFRSPWVLKERWDGDDNKVYDFINVGIGLDDVLGFDVRKWLIPVEYFGQTHLVYNKELSRIMNIDRLQNIAC